MRVRTSVPMALMALSAVTLAACERGPLAEAPVAPVAGAATGAVVAGPLGAAVGVLAGPYVADLLEEEEIINIGAAERQAVETGRDVRWQARDGLSGEVRVLRTFTDDQGRQCREIVQTIQLPERTVTPTAVACRDPDGEWRFMEASQP